MKPPPPEPAKTEEECAESLKIKLEKQDAQLKIRKIFDCAI